MRITIFAKGNLDVRDSLHSLRRGETVLWNGINEIVRSRFPGVTVRIRHELWSRSDALLEATGTVPAALLERALPLDRDDLATQFSRELFESEADAFVLSVQPDVMAALTRHRLDGFLFHARNLENWPAEERAWVAREFTPTWFLSVEQSMQNLAAIVERLRSGSDAPILIYNMSAVVPGESIRCYADFPEVVSTRIRRFNLGLIELSRQTGITIVDVDRIVAQKGADHLKFDALHMTVDGCRAVAEEVVEALDELSHFSVAVG